MMVSKDVKEVIDILIDEATFDLRTKYVEKILALSPDRVSMYQRLKNFSLEDLITSYQAVRNFYDEKTI